MEGDEARVIPLFELVFGEWPRFDLECSKEDYWDWKFKDPPMKINQVFVAEKKDGQIIGASAGIIKRVKIGDEVVHARKGGEAAVHPDYRGRGVYSNIWKLKEKFNAETGVVFRWSLTASPVLIERNKKRDSDVYEPPFPHSLKQYVHIKNIDRFLGHLNRRRKLDWMYKLKVLVGYSVLKSFNRVKNIFTPKVNNYDFIVDNITAFDDRIDVFWEEVKDDYDFIVEKSREYLNWRYCDVRGGDYKVYLAEDLGSILGYIVLRINKIDPLHSIGYIMELLALRDRYDVVDCLIKQAMKHFKSEKTNAIYFSVIAGHPYEKIIRKHGFLDSRRKPYLSYRDYHKLDEIYKFVNATPDRLHYQFGEFDSI